MISNYGPDSPLTLVRNPYFRQWSFAAQPAGYPNVIQIVRVDDPRKRLSAVAAGRADLVDFSFDGLSHRSLAIRYPARVHSGLKLSTTFLFLNTRQPPFTSLKARQAVNYAIDRRQIIQLLHLGSPGQATPTCQVLPPGFPGYQPDCPYTAGAKDGTWHGPDMAKAVRLAHESGTTHVPVTVWIDKGFGGQALGSYLVGILKDLGYRANMRIVSDGKTFAMASNSRNKVQLGLSGWLVIIPSASDLFLPVLSCRSFYQDPARTNNVAEFCDPHTDRLVSQARAAQQADPAAARKLWAQADRAVTDQAPWVPLFNESGLWFVSARVHNSQESPYYDGPLLDQMWVR